MESIQVYAYDGREMRKIGSPVPAFNDANLLVGLYPDMCRDLGVATPTPGFKFFAIRENDMHEFHKSGWKQVT